MQLIVLDTGLFASLVSALPKPILILTAPNDVFQVLLSTLRLEWL
jgi:hypothetical protein